MYLIQILLPLFDNDRRRLPVEHYRAVVHELTEQFGGLTAFTRSPADGLWRDGQEQLDKDLIVIYEVMAPGIDAEWWARYRAGLEKRFRQEQVIVRASPIQLLG